MCDLRNCCYVSDYALCYKRNFDENPQQCLLPNSSQMSVGNLKPNTAVSAGVHLPLDPGLPHTTLNHSEVIQELLDKHRWWGGGPQADGLDRDSTTHQFHFPAHGQWEIQIHVGASVSCKGWSVKGKRTLNCPAGGA